MSDDEELPPERQNEVLSDPYYIPDGEPERPDFKRIPTPEYEDNVDGGDGGGLFDVIDKAKKAALNITNGAIETVDIYANQKMKEVVKGQSTGGAEYSLFDTVMLVFIILAILVLLYVVLAESGALSAAESGVQYLTGGCGCEK